MKATFQNVATITIGSSTVINTRVGETITIDAVTDIEVEELIADQQFDQSGLHRLISSDTVDRYLSDNHGDHQIYQLTRRHFPITHDEALEEIDFRMGGKLSEEEQMQLSELLRDNPMTPALLAMHTWKEQDTLEFLKHRFGSKITSKQDILAAVADFLDNNMPL